MTEIHNRLAVNTKYFSKTKVSSEKGHVNRMIADEKNVIPELRGNTFGIKESVIDQRYEDAEKLMMGAKKKSNTLIDSVLMLPLEQFEIMQKEHPKDWQKKVHESMINTMNEMSKELGFYPLGYRFHLDEGAKNDDGTFTLNPHAHMLFANICTHDLVLQKERKITVKDTEGKTRTDEKGKYIYARDGDGKIKTESYSVQLKNKMPLQYHRGRGDNTAWSLQQDIAAKHFERLGFKRGLTEDIKRKHLEKEAFVLEQHKKEKAKLIEENKLLSNRNTNLLIINNELENETNEVKRENMEIKQENQNLEKTQENMLSWFENTVNKNIEALKKYIEKTVNCYEKIKKEAIRKQVAKNVEKLEESAFTKSPDLKAAENSLKQALKSSEKKLQTKSKMKLK